MKSNNWFRLKFVISMVISIGILNSYMFFQLAQTFFSTQIRIFLFVLFNEIYFALGLIFIYFYAKYRELILELNETKYIIKSISKRSKK